MNNEETKKIIDLYFDNELEKNQEVFLFTLLSGNEEAREYFKHLNIIRNAVNESAEDLPVSLEERIFNSIENKTVRQGIFRGNFFINAASLGIAALLLIISSFLFFEVKEYRSRVETVSERMKIQEMTIDLILNNSLPPAEVRTKRANEIIVNANL